MPEGMPHIYLLTITPTQATISGKSYFSHDLGLIISNTKTIMKILVYNTFQRGLTVGTIAFTHTMFLSLTSDCLTIVQICCCVSYL